MKVKLSDVCDIVKGKTTITKAIEGEYPLVVTGENRLSNNNFQFDCSAVCVPLVSATGHGHASIKRIHFQEGKFALGSILAAVIPKSTEQVNPRYLHIYLSYFKDSILVPLMRGSANVSLTIKSLGSAEIDLPSIEKQIEIVELVSKVEGIKANMDTYLLEQEDIVNKMKKEILKLAVQGRLGTQNPNDEPAELLLENIKEEKRRMVEEGKIKKEKPLMDININDYSFKLPYGWSLAYMQDITSCITCGLASTPKYVEEGKMFLSAKNVKPFKFMPEDHKFISDEDFKKITKQNKPEVNDILLTRVGAGIGEATIIDQDLEFAIYVSLTLIKPVKEFINSKYLLCWINSPEGVFRAISSTFGKGVSQGNLNVNQVRQYIIPIPPLKEQKRIVEKVDILISLCDELKSRIEKQKDYSNRLMESILKYSL